MAQKRKGRRWLRWTLFALAPLLLIVLAVAGMLFTSPGRNMLAGIAEKFASSPGQTIDIGQVGGDNLSALTFNHITISDTDGPWFQLRDVTLDWSPWDLVSARLNVENLTAADAVIARLPPENTASDKEDSGGLPLSIDVRNLNVDRLDLGPTVMGTPASLSLNGSAKVADLASGIDGRLNVRRLDAPGTVEGRFVYRPAENRLTTQFTASEPAGGLIVRSLDIEGLPPFTASVDADGTFDNWRADLKMDIGDESLLEGTAEISRAGDSHRLTYGFTAQPAPLLPAGTRDLFAGTFRVDGMAQRGASGEIRIERTGFSSRQLNGSIDALIAGDGSLRMAILVADLDSNTGPHAVTLENGDRISLTDGRIEAKASVVDGGLLIEAKLTADGLDTPQVATARLTADMTARASPQILSGPRDLSAFSVAANVNGVERAPSGLRDALGPDMALEARGATRGDTIELSTATVRTATGDIGLDGTVTPQRFDGRFRALLPDLARLTDYAGTPLTGRLELSGSAGIAFATAESSLDVTGTVNDLTTGNEKVDALLGETVSLRGAVATADGGVSFDNLRLEGSHIGASVDGSVGGETAQLSAKGNIARLSLIAPELEGSIDFDATVTGSRDAARMSAILSGTSVSVDGRSFANPAIRFDGSGPIATPTGKLTVTGQFADRDLAGDGNVTVGPDGGARVDDLVLTYGDASARGNVAYDPELGPSGTLAFELPDLEAFGDLTGVTIKGALSADAELVRNGNIVSLEAKGRAENLAYDTTQVRRIDLDGRVSDIFGRAVAEGTAEIIELDADGTQVPAIRLTAVADDDKTKLSVATRLMETDLTASGGVLIDGERITVSLTDASATRLGQQITLASPADIVVEDSSATLSNVTLASGNGRATINGVAGQTLDLAIELARMPARLANAFVPDLGADGDVSGTIRVSGPATAPVGQYDLTANAMSVAAMRENGIAALSGGAAGRLADGKVTLAGRLSGRDGMALDISGSLPAGSDAPIDLSAKGDITLAIADPALATRGGSVQGTMRADVRVTGSASAPVIDGTFTTSNARLRDPESGIDISDIDARIAMNSDAVTIERFTGNTEKNGRISASGRVGLAAGNPSDIKIVARDFNLENEQLVKGTLDADLALTGPLTAGPTLRGKVDIARLDITIPDALPPSVRKLDVQHRNANAAVRRQAEALRKKEKDGPSLPVSLDLQINAANRIFVRGRGIDAVLGGSVGLAGTTNNPVIQGAFRLARGRLDILDRRLDFSRGNVEFTGSADPNLDFAASTVTSAAQVSVLVSGPSSEPKFTFESSPDLPQDEVLAQLIFDRSLSELSPLQIARLSSEIARLGGLAGGTSLLGELQNALGIDELDLSGGGASAGRYINENVYLGVKQSGTDTGSAVIDLDITKNLKARGEFGSDGKSKVGVGVEFEY